MALKNVKNRDEINNHAFPNAYLIYQTVGRVTGIQKAFDIKPFRQSAIICLCIANKTLEFLVLFRVLMALLSDTKAQTSQG